MGLKISPQVYSTSRGKVNRHIRTNHARACKFKSKHPRFYSVIGFQPRHKVNGIYLNYYDLNWASNKTVTFYYPELKLSISRYQLTIHFYWIVIKFWKHKFPDNYVHPLMCLTNRFSRIYYLEKTFLFSSGCVWDIFRNSFLVFYGISISDFSSFFYKGIPYQKFYSLL